MNCKGAGLLPLFVIILFFHSALGEKLVEVSVQITKLRFLPSASADTRGFARQGQRFVVDGESGPWYRIRLYNSIVWIGKDAVTVLERSETPPPPPASTQTTPKPTITPADGQESKTTGRTGTGRIGDGQPASPSVIRSDNAPIDPLKTETTTTAPSETTRTAETEAIASSGTPHSSGSPTFRPNRSSASETPARPKKEPKATATQTWFSQFSRMPQVPSGEEGRELGFFQVAAVDAPVFYWPETNAAILAKAKKGDFFIVRETTDVWCKIVVRDTAGWIVRVKGTISDKPKAAFIDELLLIFIIAGLAIVVAIIMLVILLSRRKSRAPSPRADSFHALIIARSPPNIQCIISNKTLSLEKYLAAIGFIVRAAHDLKAAQHSIIKAQTDIVFIDWNISDDIPGTVEVLFANFEVQKLPLAIFFNVPDLSSIPLIPVLLRAYHLGASFSDHDISKLITPTILSKTSPKSGAASALEGDIAEGNLPEILQSSKQRPRSG
jgi:hypothetical protein